MTVQIEAQLEGEFRRRIHTMGGQTIKLAPTERGVPDRLVMLPGGRMYLVELKTPTGHLSPIQIEWHRKVSRLGIRVATVYGSSGVTEWIRHITEEYRYEMMTAEHRARRDGLDEVI